MFCLFMYLFLNLCASFFFMHLSDFRANLCDCGVAKVAASPEFVNKNQLVHHVISTFTLL